MAETLTQKNEDGVSDTRFGLCKDNTKSMPFMLRECARDLMGSSSSRAAGVIYRVAHGTVV